MTTEKRIVHPLEPVFDKCSQILLLGSFPSVKTRAEGFFYGHPQNRFWPLMSEIFRITPQLSISEPERARKFLLEQHIALWDSIYACRIKGSQDSSITDVEPTPLAPLVKESQIKHVFCNGQSSYKYYMKYQDKAIGLPVTVLPSTSPANAAWSLERLVDAWQIIRETLEA